MTSAPEPVERPGQRPCPHCPDGHQDPRRVPWCVTVSPGRDGRDGRPINLHVCRTDLSHVAESDARWLSELIHTYRDADLGATPESPEVPPDELTEAEGWFVYWQTVGTSAHDGEERRAAVVLEAEYTRMRAEIAELRAALAEAREGTYPPLAWCECGHLTQMHNIDTNGRCCAFLHSERKRCACTMFRAEETTDD